MISVLKAASVVLENSLTLAHVSVSINCAVGRVLMEDIFADRDFPPFDRVTMDGIAIKYNDWQSGTREYAVSGLQAAGMPLQEMDEKQACFEVMTGAILPKGTDTVIRYEDVQIADDIAKIQCDNINNGQNIHRQGYDVKLNEILLKKGKKISPAEVAVLATVGKANVIVADFPKIAIVSTGDELVDVSEMPDQHQLRMSNVYAMQAALLEHGITASLHHIHDKKQVLKQKLEKILKDHDAVILSGGVSKGKLDFVPEVLDEIGVEKYFHKVKQRPGKPFWFGKSSDSVVFALPGNPVSTFMCFYRYIMPWLYKSFEQAVKPMRVQLTSDYSFKPELTYLLQCKLKIDVTGQLIAEPNAGQGSGDLANLTSADGFLELPSDRTEFKKGEVFDFYKYR